MAISDLNLTITPHNQFHPSLLVNFDQTGVDIVPKSSYTFDVKGSKAVPIVGHNDRRQITAVVASSADGDMLPIQVIFKGETHVSVDNIAQSIRRTVEADGFHLAYSPNHWSNQRTMVEYVEKVLLPHRTKMIAKHNLPKEMPLIVLLDCWPVHAEGDFPKYMKSIKHIVLRYVPRNCTSKLQVADVALNFPFKHGIRHRFNEWMTQLARQRIEHGEDDIAFGKEDLLLSTLKPQVLQWMHSCWKSMASQRALIVSGWQKCVFRFADPFSLAEQVRAMHQFKNGNINEPDEAESSDEEGQWSDEETDEEKDELDVMKEIHHGTRRSTRSTKNKQPARLHMGVDPTAIVEDDEAELSNFAQLGLN